MAGVPTRGDRDRGRRPLVAAGLSAVGGGNDAQRAIARGAAGGAPTAPFAAPPPLSRHRLATSPIRTPGSGLIGLDGRPTSTPAPAVASRNDATRAALAARPAIGGPSPLTQIARTAAAERLFATPTHPPTSPVASRAPLGRPLSAMAAMGTGGGGRHTPPHVADGADDDDDAELAVLTPRSRTALLEARAQRLKVRRLDEPAVSLAAAPHAPATPVRRHHGRVHCAPPLQFLAALSLVQELDEQLSRAERVSWGLPPRPLQHAGAMLRTPRSFATPPAAPNVPLCWCARTASLTCAAHCRIQHCMRD